MHPRVCRRVSGVGWEPAVVSGIHLCSWKSLGVPKGDTVPARSTTRLSPRALCRPSLSWSLSVSQLSFLPIVLKDAALRLPALLPSGSALLWRFARRRTSQPSAWGVRGRSGAAGQRNSTSGSRPGFNRYGRDGKIVFSFCLWVNIPVSS